MNKGASAAGGKWLYFEGRRTRPSHSLWWLHLAQWLKWQVGIVAIDRVQRVIGVYFVDPHRDDTILCADSATPFETQGGLLRRSREPIVEPHTHGVDSGLRNIRMFLKPGCKILNKNNVVVPTGFEPVFKP